MAEYDRDFLTTKHKLYEDNILNWEFYIRSFLGGNDYKNGYNLHRYIFELYCFFCVIGVPLSYELFGIIYIYNII